MKTPPPQDYVSGDDVGPTISPERLMSQPKRPWHKPRLWVDDFTGSGPQPDTNNENSHYFIMS